MQIENHKEEVPFSHYEDLFRQADPAEISARLPHTNYDGKAFYVNLLGTTYTIPFVGADAHIGPHASVTVTSPTGQIPPLPVQTFLLRYLLESKQTPWAGAWKTFREMPWGELYIKPYTGRVLTRAAFTFGTRIDAFQSACEKLGGIKLSHGDAGYQLELLDGYRMQILVWAGDDEFPPSAQVLYSDNFEAAFAPEDRVVAGDILITTIKSMM